jgi:hypothetical protein
MDNLAANYVRADRHAEALKLYQERLALMKAKFGLDHPETLTSMYGVARSLVGLDRDAEALPIIDECLRRAGGKSVAVDLIPGGFWTDSNPAQKTAGKSVPPDLIPALLYLRLQHFEKTKDAAGCRATAEEYEKLKPTDVGSLYNGACIHAATAAVIRASDKSATAAKDAAAEADRAVAWVKRAVAAGYKDTEELKKNKDLDVLRDRDDFRKLLADLQGGKESDKK